MSQGVLWCKTERLFCQLGRGQEAEGGLRVASQLFGVIIG